MWCGDNPVFDMKQWIRSPSLVADETLATIFCFDHCEDGKELQDGDENATK
jgi:hypothetical protein